MLCGPCAIARWLHTHQVIVTKIATRAVADHLDKLTPLTAESAHVCRGPVSVDHRGTREPLLAPVNQWGHAPFPLTPLTPHAVSRQARDLLDGIITAHRVLPVHRQEPTEVIPRNQFDDGAGPTPGYRPERHRAALDRRRADLADLVGVAAEPSSTGGRLELDRRITQLLTLATAP